MNTYIPQTPAFALAEYQRRVANVRAEMQQRGIDLLVVHNLSNICYLTGFQTLGSYGYGHYAAIVSLQGDVVLFSSDFESHNAHLYGWVDRIHTYSVHDSAGVPLDALAGCLRELASSRCRVGYEAGHYSLTVDEWQQLSRQLPDVEWLVATDIVDRVKCVKSPAEIAVMRRAAALTSAGLLAGIEAISEGVCDNHVAATMYQTVIECGGEYFSLQPVVTSGKRAGIPHSTFRRQPLRCGDTVFLELSACVDRYASPALRTVSMGSPSKEVARAHVACLASVDTLLAGIRPGRTAADVAQAAGRALRAIEPDLIWHGYYGYSVGITFPPMCTDCVSGVLISDWASLTLVPGMIFHCSTSLRKLGEFGVTCGETVLVTEQGCEVLTTVPRELVIR